MRTAGHYEIVEELGAGPAGVVHLARHRETGRVVALKELRVTGADPAAKARFLQAAGDIARQLEDPHILPVHEVFDADGTAFVAMEYEEHGSLRRLVGGLTMEQAVTVIEDALAGLRAAARRGIVHGHLKPENLLVSAAGRARIGDFGADAAPAEESDWAVTPPDQTMEAVAYSAPEQAMGGQAGTTTDLYALGCIAYETLAGHVPFHDSDTPVALVYRRVTEDVPPLRTVAPGVPPELGDWVDRLLARDPAQRFPSPEAASEELERAVVSEPAATVAEPAPADTTTCPTCGHENARDSDFCDGCGEYLRWEPTDMLPAVTPPATAEPSVPEPAPSPEAPEPAPAAPMPEPVELPPPEPIPAPAAQEPPPLPELDDGDWATVQLPSVKRREEPEAAPAAPQATKPQRAVPPPAAAAPPPPAPVPPEPVAVPEARVATAPPQPDAAPARKRRGFLRAAAGALFGGRSRDAEPAPVEEALALAPAPEPELVRRTPHMDLSAEPPLIPGTVFDVTVLADRTPARHGEEVEELLIRVPAGVRTLDLDVWLVATHHFLITDAPIRRLSLGVDDDRSTEARFRVAVVAPAAPGDEPVITASFSANGRPSGRVTRVVPVLAAGPADVAAPLAAGATAAVLEVDLDARAPDLTLEIAAPENDGRRFEVRVDTPLLDLERRTETWFLPADASEMVTGAMEHFFDGDATPAARLSSLRGAGLEFFDAAPVLFKEAFWRLVDAGKPPRNLFVVSDERSIPWELMVPSRRGPEGYEEREPLGVELAVGRWHRHTCVSPRQRVPLASSYVVAPRYEGSSHLVHAAAEAEFVCRHFGGTRIDPANFANLDQALGRGGADLLHFVCHGEADDRDQLLRLEEPDTLRAQQIRAMPGLARACRERHPLVFLNACEAGRPARGLIGASGFARSFIEVDASGIVGTLWSVDDETAHAVAIAFYEALLADRETPFAEALRTIRARGYATPGDDSYAAYCFYGDPTAGLP